MAIVEVQPRYQVDFEPETRLGPELAFPSVFPGRQTWYTIYGKRFLDVVLASAGLLILLPVFLVIAALVRLNLGPGGVIYRQQRVGRDGESFDIFKFRSMLPDRRQQSQPFVGRNRRVSHKSDSDPRHTSFGRFLRANSIDELPQLINVIRGDMSLVGPRPELVTVARRGGLTAHPRHQERPGITGLFQISNLRSTNRIRAGPGRCSLSNSSATHQRPGQQLQRSRRDLRTGHGSSLQLAPTSGPVSSST